MTTILGTIAGDFIGSVYEFNNTKDYDFPLFSEGCSYTDDSVVTMAVAEWLLTDQSCGQDTLVQCMVDWGNRFPYPLGGYGGGFSRWLFMPEHLSDYGTGESSGERHPYGSFGNGSAMRVGPVGWFFDSLEETERVAKISAEVTHNHPEGIKGAQATALAIWMARNGRTKKEIRKYIQKKFGYDLERSWKDLHENYAWDGSCQGTVPEAMIAFLESCNFEDAIRKAVCMGGDSDTLAAITGSIAEAFYGGVPEYIAQPIITTLPPEFLWVLADFSVLCFNKFSDFFLAHSKT